MDIAGPVRRASVFVPELGPLEPNIVAAWATIQKIRETIAPAVTRIDAGEPAFLEEAEAAAKLNAMLPDLLALLKTADALEVVVANYAAKMDKAAS